MERYNDIRGIRLIPLISLNPFFLQPLPDHDEHFLPLGDSVCRQAVGGGVQLHPAVLVLHEAFRPQHMAARGVGEEGRDILFELLAREAQLQKVGRTKGPMRLALPASNYSKRKFFFYRFNATALFFHKHSLWFSI